MRNTSNYDIDSDPDHHYDKKVKNEKPCKPQKNNCAQAIGKYLASLIGENPFLPYSDQAHAF
jgi:hypothetical protein